MRIRMKLNVANDMDIITLSQCQFPLAEWIKISLKTYVEENRFLSIPLPAVPDRIVAEKKAVNFTLQPAKDERVIAWLQRIRTGQRSGIIKSIFRASLVSPCLAGYFAEGCPEETPTRRPATPPSNDQASASAEKSQIKVMCSETQPSEHKDETDEFDIFAIEIDDF